MNPFFFGTRERRLFGIYTPGRAGVGRGGRAVVLCNPWGQEYLRAHRSLRHLGNLLTRAGIDVLRFDYFGTGDSGGEFADADLRGWQEDIETALDELKDTSGAARVGLAGLRLGGTLAAAVAARRRDVDCLALWDPVVRGDEYLRELWKDSEADGSPQPKGEREVLGFVLTGPMSEELASVDLCASVRALPGRTLVVASEPLPSHVPLREALASRPGPPVPLEELEGPPAWREDRSTGVGAIPVNVLQRIVQWWG